MKGCEAGEAGFASSVVGGGGAGGGVSGGSGAEGPERRHGGLGRSWLTGLENWEGVIFMGRGGNWSKC